MKKINIPSLSAGLISGALLGGLLVFALAPLPSPAPPILPEEEWWTQADIEAASQDPLISAEGTRREIAKAKLDALLDHHLDLPGREIVVEGVAAIRHNEEDGWAHVSAGYEEEARVVALAPVIVAHYTDEIREEWYKRMEVQALLDGDTPEAAMRSIVDGYVSRAIHDALLYGHDEDHWRRWIKRQEAKGK